MPSNLQNVNTMSKSMMIYGTEGTGGLASSTNQLVSKPFYLFLFVQNLEGKI